MAARPAKTSDEKRKRKLQHYKKAQRRSEIADKTIQELETAVKEFDPTETITSFSSFPLSSQTKKGLQKAFYTTPTDIQVRSLPPCLQGNDILATARTGSGKTLCFLIPILELLFRRKWGPQDGLGAVVISPTRELAVQTFDVLRNIGGYHNFSAGLVIGGKNLKEESVRVARMNILIATPGRLLQHLDQAVGFECDNLQILVLDEADRIMDLGFSRTLNAIIEHLPKSTKRQTLLFSATQSSSISSLARLSLSDPLTISVQESGSQTLTPKNLTQHYVVCELDRKVDLLWSFIRSHLKSKCIVFVTCTKQVRFFHKTFSSMQPGVSLLHLHGHQSQTTRLNTFARFSAAGATFLICTDIASRGLDFPAVDWVLQLDCPEDVDTYVHRVGRTARYEKGGNALTVLLPSEVAFVNHLSQKGLDVEDIKVKSSKMTSVQNKLQLCAFRDPEVKYLAQRAFISYVRSVHLQADKEVFKLDELPLQKFAESLGLMGTPKIKFLKKGTRAKGSETIISEEKSVAERPVRTKYDRMFQRKNQNVLSQHYNELIDDGRSAGSDSDADSDDSSQTRLDKEAGFDSEEDFITLARADHELPDSSHPFGPTTALTTALSSVKAIPEDPDAHLSKRKVKEGQSKKAMLKYKGAPTKLTFDDEGVAHEMYEMEELEEGVDPESWKVRGKDYVEGLEDKLKEADARDRAEAREKRREKKRLRKEKEREMRNASSNGGVQAVLTGHSQDEDDGYESPKFDLPEEEDEDEDPQRPAKRQRRGDVGDSGAVGGAELERLALEALGQS